MRSAHLHRWAPRDLRYWLGVTALAIQGAVLVGSAGTLLGDAPAYPIVLVFVLGAATLGWAFCGGALLAIYHGADLVAGSRLAGSDATIE